MAFSSLNMHPLHVFSSVQSLSRVRLFSTPRVAARQASLSITISRSSLRLTSIESVMPSSRLILCRPLLLLPPIPPSIRVFSNESTLCMRWPRYICIVIAIKLHNHGNSPDYSFSKGLIHSLSFKKQFLLQPFKKAILLFKGQIKRDFLGGNIFLVMNYLELFFYHREGQQAGNTGHFVKENNV